MADGIKAYLLKPGGTNISYEETNKTVAGVAGKVITLGNLETLDRDYTGFCVYMTSGDDIGTYFTIASNTEAADATITVVDSDEAGIAGLDAADGLNITVGRAATSAWIDARHIGYFEIKSDTFTEKVTVELQVTPLYGDRTFCIGYRKNKIIYTFSNMFCGNLIEADCNKFRNALHYAKSEWGELTDKYSVIYREYDGSEFGTPVDASIPYVSDGYSTWLTGTGFIRPQGMIQAFQFAEDTQNNLTLNNLTLAYGTF